MEHRTATSTLYPPKPDYLVFDSGYTARLLGDRFVKELYNELDEYEIEGVFPLFVYGSSWGGCSYLREDDPVTESGCMPIENSMIPIHAYYPEHPDDDPEQGNGVLTNKSGKAAQIMNAIEDHQLEVHGIICFANLRGRMFELFRVFDILKSLHYCNIFSIFDIQFIETQIDGVLSTIAYVSVDAESG
jgi:hypothetical protein